MEGRDKKMKKKKQKTNKPKSFVFLLQMWRGLKQMGSKSIADKGATLYSILRNWMFVARGLKYLWVPKYAMLFFLFYFQFANLAF